MPQLDRIIILPQIFWFFLIFILFYSLLSHFFLPKFINSIKLRKKIIDLNNDMFLGIEKTTQKDQLLILIQLNKNLSKVKNSIYLNSVKINFIFLDTKLVNPVKLDNCIINVIYKNMLFCNQQILNYIKLYPSNLNLR